MLTAGLHDKNPRGLINSERSETMPFDIPADSRELGGNFKQSIMKRDNSIRVGWVGEGGRRKHGGTTLKTKET